MNKSEQHKKTVEEFLNSTLGRYKDVMNYEIRQDEEQEDNTSFEVKITNTTNESKRYVFLQATDDEGIYMLLGEEFEPMDEIGFFAHLFMWEFLTMQEV